MQLLGDRGAADEAAALEHQHVEPRLGEVRRVGQAVVASADDDRVVGVRCPCCQAIDVLHSVRDRGELDGRTGLARGVVEGQPVGGGRHREVLVVDGDLQVHRRALRGVLGQHPRHADVALEHRRVHQAGGVADALVAVGAAVEHRLPRHGVLVLGHDQAALEVEPLELLPVDPQADRRPARGAVAELALDGAAADERPVLAQRGAVLAEHPAEAELLGREPLGVGEGVAGRGELDADQGQAGLDPQHQQGVLAEGAEALPVAGLDDLVEDAEGVVGLDEHLEARGRRCTRCARS